tara:strand:- start:148 stop:441 length:294 start_codon:yes stop_codon:yes gene_type:complete
MNKLALTIMLPLFLFSCQTQQFVTANEGSNEIKRQDKFDHFFVSGIGQEVVTNAAEVCKGSENVAKIERSNTFLNWFVGFLSSGIYTPQQSRVYCNK